MNLLCYYFASTYFFYFNLLTILFVYFRFTRKIDLILLQSTALKSSILLARDVLCRNHIGFYSFLSLPINSASRCIVNFVEIFATVMNAKRCKTDIVANKMLCAKIFYQR